MVEHVKIEDMTWTEVKAAVAQGYDTAVVVLSAIEQHGPHCPIGTDSFTGEAVGERVTRKLGKALMAPVARVGWSDEHNSFPGTISIRKQVMIEVVKDYIRSLQRAGFRNVAIINTHGSMSILMGEVGEDLKREFSGINLIPHGDLFELMACIHQVSERFGIDPTVSGAHAGESETSMILALRPELVHMDRAEPGFMGELDEKTVQAILTKGTEVVAENGVMGDPRPARAESGEAYLEAWADMYAEFIRRYLPKGS